MTVPSKSDPPKLLAATSDTYQTSIKISIDRENAILDGKLGNGLEYTAQTRKTGVNGGESNCFRSIEWTPDGTSLITTSEDNCLRTFIVPPDLLSPQSIPLTLTPYSLISHPSTIYTHAIYPHFSLSNPSTTLSIISTPSHPLQLRSLLTGLLHASYPLINASTEKWLTPSSLLWTEDSTQFICGTDSLISFFDAGRDGQEPATSFKTREKGIVSSMGIKGGILVTGTWNRWVSVYDDGGMGDVVHSFSLRDDENGDGGGISSVGWDEDGINFYVCERKSDVIRVYDIRKLDCSCAVILGRNATETNQRMGIGVGKLGQEQKEVVVGGGEDGMVKIWSRDGGEIGGWKASYDPVSDVAIHPTGCVVATCSGSRKLWQEEDVGVDDNTIWDNSLQIWAV